MTRNDLILIAAMLMLSLLPLFPFPFSHFPYKALIKVDGEIVRELDLTAEETFTLETSGGKNIVEIKSGAVSVIAADCPDKICVKRGAIKKVFSQAIK